MAQRISRREFAARAAAAGALAAVPKVGASASQTAKIAEEPLHPSLPDLETLLAMPVPEAMKKQVSDALKYLQGLSETRWKTKLNDGSEPATIYRATKARLNTQPAARRSKGKGKP
jgi:hypothetical protein